MPNPNSPPRTTVTEIERDIPQPEHGGINVRLLDLFGTVSVRGHNRHTKPTPKYVTSFYINQTVEIKFCKKSIKDGEHRYSMVQDGDKAIIEHIYIYSGSKSAELRLRMLTGKYKNKKLYFSDTNVVRIINKKLPKWF